MAAEPATVARTPGKLLVQTSRLDAIIWESSALAVDKAVRPDVRRFARHVMAGHRRSAIELSRLASSEGIVIAPGSGGIGGRVTFSDLTGSGPERFDLLFVEFQLRAHVDLINLYSTYWTEGRIPSLRDFCKRQLRVEHEHYRQAIRLRERIRGLGALVVATR